MWGQVNGHSWEKGGMGFCEFKARLGAKAWQCLKDEHQKCSLMPLMAYGEPCFRQKRTLPCAVGSPVSDFRALSGAALPTLPPWGLCETCAAYSGGFVTDLLLPFVGGFLCAGGSVDWCWQPLRDWEEQWRRLLFGTPGFQGKSCEAHVSPQLGLPVSKTIIQKVSLLIVELLGHYVWLRFLEGAIWGCFFPECLSDESLPEVPLPGCSPS